MIGKVGLTIHPDPLHSNGMRPGLIKPNQHRVSIELRLDRCTTVYQEVEKVPRDCRHPCRGPWQRYFVGGSQTAQGEMTARTNDPPSRANIIRCTGRVYRHPVNSNQSITRLDSPIQISRAPFNDNSHLFLAPSHIVSKRGHFQPKRGIIMQIVCQKVLHSSVLIHQIVTCLRKGLTDSWECFSCAKVQLKHLCLDHAFAVDVVYPPFRVPQGVSNIAAENPKNQMRNSRHLDLGNVFSVNFSDLIPDGSLF
mmetsp:Transcript_23904/g.48243  ORF Transcript_23904/g.48243 Transcript_23904/m.48243 type:complete len:252 (+) Transcript_23904:100-855(+)